MPHKLFKIGVKKPNTNNCKEEFNAINVKKCDLIEYKSENFDISLKCNEVRYEPKLIGFNVYLSANVNLTNGTVTDNLPIAPVTFINNPSGNIIGYIEGITLDFTTGIFRVPHAGIYNISSNQQVSCADATVGTPVTFTATLEGPSFAVASVTDTFTDVFPHTLSLSSQVKLYPNIDYRFRLASNLNNKVLYGLIASNFNVSCEKLTC